MWKALAELFQGSKANHGTTNLTGHVKDNGKQEARSFTVAGEPSPEDWERHVSGGWPSLGAIPLMDDGRSIRFAALDIDVYRDMDFVAIEKKLAAKSIPGLITKSKSGGVHIWFFFAKPVTAKPVIAKLSQIAAYLGYGNAEKFPPTGERIKEHDVGTWINLPFHGKERQGFINGKTVTLKQFATVAKKKAVTDLSKFLSLDTGLDGESQFADGPPCLQRLDKEGVVEGMRNETLFQFGLYFFTKYGAEFQERLIEYNSTLDDPLPSGEIQRIADSIQTRETYFYSCSKEPLCSRCDRKLCVTRPYGIGQMQGVPLQGVTVGDVTQLQTDPPILILDLNEERVQLPAGIDTLANQMAMRKLCAVHLKVFPPTVGRKQYDEFINELIQRKSVVDVPEDSTPKGRFKEHLKDFITKRQSKEKDHLLNNGVWIRDDGRFTLRLLDLMQYLKREGFTYMDEGRVVATLNEMEAESSRIKIKGRDLNVWIVNPGTLQTKDYEIDNFEEPY